MFSIGSMSGMAGKGNSSTGVKWSVPNLAVEKDFVYLDTEQYKGFILFLDDAFSAFLSISVTV